MEKDKQITDTSNNCRCYGANNFGSSIGHSKLKILLCDRDTESCQEVSTLLTKCCYQVISVSSDMEVINALNSEGPYIDLILAAVDLPINTSMEMIKYIMQDKNFHQIPVIMLSTQDETFLIHKYLKLGATDYLVKPLCKNEILNLWMHMSKKRRMNNILNYGLGHLVTNEANMSNIIIFEDTDNKLLQTASTQRIEPNIYQQDT
ncbi:two-component response regulator-like APRR1 isoform X3 [Ziziphus jujuba]|uniref:Two-component response regulator-like APRR1 isoform X3 n=1 Tax=Ziziphus jujuba TaxID=326968 RepID=A0A6P4AT25_ZIZJJ|nr:two-component response regulator-like APRR1 isoform X3 [Ziziphus jujuba]